MKKFLALAVLLTFCFLLTSCSSGAAGSNGATEGSASSAAVAEDSAEGAQGVGNDAQSVTVENNRKIIEYTTLHVQTKTFDTLLDGISQQIAQCGGYVESSEIAGNDYRSSGNRYATLVVRVPSENKQRIFQLCLRQQHRYPSGNTYRGRDLKLCGYGKPDRGPEN